MKGQSRHNGPGKGAPDIVKRIITLVVSILETRLQLVAIELEEGKAALIKLILIAMGSLLLMMLALISLLTVVFYSIDPAWRLSALFITSVVSFLLAIIGFVWASVKARRSRLLDFTRQQLAIDRTFLEKNR